MFYLFNKLRLLPPDSLISTSDVDHADWNYRPFLKIIQRTRFKIISSLLSKKHYGRILEVGYGSGVFMPHLSDYCDELYGADPHSKNKEVEEVLLKNNVKAKLYSSSVTSLFFEDDYFDSIVIVSALEYVDDIEVACKEMQRILKPDGELIVITPGSTPIVDFGLKLLTGESAKENYDERRRILEPTILKYFTAARKIISPPLIHPIIRLYTAYKLINNK